MEIRRRASRHPGGDERLYIEDSTLYTVTLDAAGHRLVFKYKGVPDPRRPDELYDWDVYLSMLDIQRGFQGLAGGPPP
jgi:hypothetical protein